MSNQNGIISAPVSLHADVYPVLGLGKEGEFYDVATVCGNGHGKVNKWSKYKPVKNASPGELSEEEFTDSNFGYQSKKLKSFRELGENGVPFPSEWEYLPPRPGTDWCRLTDFVGYDHNAGCIVGGTTWPESIFFSGSFGVSLDFSPERDSNFTATDFFRCMGLPDGKYLWLTAVSDGAVVARNYSNAGQNIDSAQSLACSMDLDGKVAAGDDVELFLTASSSASSNEMYDLRCDRNVVAYQKYRVSKYYVRVNVTLDPNEVVVSGYDGGKTYYFRDPLNGRVYSTSKRVYNTDIKVRWDIISADYPAESTSFYIYGVGLRTSNNEEVSLIPRADPSTTRGRVRFYPNGTSGNGATEQLTYLGTTFALYEDVEDAINDASDKRVDVYGYPILDAEIDRQTKAADPLYGRTLYFQMDIPPFESDTHEYRYFYPNDDNVWRID